MKPVYLEFCGVNSFSEKAIIDFRKLLSGGVFGIFGDTGSGKSTILDCIHIALYGEIERSSETDCINHKCDGFSIIFEFESVNQGVRRTYRVERSRNRKKKVEAKLYEQSDDGKWMALADGVTEVKNAVISILGLEYDDFKMCIALPQGKFSSLVKAKPKDRLGLVSRLFDLGRFGDQLNAVIREKKKRAESEIDVLSGQMEGAEDCTKEKIAEEEQVLLALQAEIAAGESLLKTAQERFQRCETLYLDKQKYDKAVAEWLHLEGLMAEYLRKKEALQKLPLAKEYCQRAKAVTDAQKDIDRETESLKTIEKDLLAAEARWQEWKRVLQEENYDGRLEECNKTLGILLAAASDVKARNAAELRLKEAIAEYKKIDKALQEMQEDFDGELKKIEARLEELGADEGLSEFVKRNFSQEVRNEVYAGVRADLQMLGQRYPVAADDVAALLQKYAPMQGGQAFDYAAAKAQYDALEQERKRLHAKRESIVKKKQEYEALLQKRELWRETGKLAREEYQAAEDKIAGVRALGTQQSVDAEIQRLKREKQATEERVERELNEYNRLLTLKSKTESAKQVYETNLAQAKQLFEAVQAQGNFVDVAQAMEIVNCVGKEDVAQRDVEAFFQQHATLCRQKAEAEARGVQAFSMDEYNAAQAECEQLQKKQNERLVESGKRDSLVKALQENAKKYAETKRKLDDAKKRQEEWEKLLKLLAGNRSGKTLMEFVASEYLRDICEAATVTLLKLTGGRYFLKYNADFFVGDNLDGGNLRQVSTLSGGETFLVSLSLALSLSAAICQKSMRPAEFFFLDEGFGTLDRTLVDTVMDVLGKVSKEFSVGLISHVDELKLRIENKIEVTGATKTQGSSVRVVAY